MAYQPPHWSGYPPSSYHGYQQQPAASGHDLALGTTLGQLLAGQERTIFILEMIHTRLAENADIMEKRLPEKTPLASEEKRDPMSVRDWVQIGIAVFVVLAALSGKVPLKEAIPLIGKPFGF